MNSAIKTNKLNCDIDRKAISEKYSIFQIKTSDKYFSTGAYILDDPELNKNVLSVLFESGKVFYVLSNIDAISSRTLKEIIDKTEEHNKISFEKADIYTLPDNIILQLLLNAVSSQKLTFLRFSNLTGHLYVYHPEWIERSRTDSTIFRIKSLEYKITNDKKLLINVRTFSSGALRKKITFGKKKYKDYPKYIMSTNYTLRRKLKDDNQKDEFILRQIDGKKSEISFLDFTDLKNFECSKMGVTANIIEAFNEKYKGYANIDLEAVNISASIDCKSTLKKENDKVVSTALACKNIKIIDYIDDEYSKMFCQQVIETFKRKYGVKAEIGKRLSKNNLNIRVIHNDEYYGTEIPDPHDKKIQGYSVQHITFEDFSKHIESAVTTVAHELIIKDDLNKGKITLFDWENLGFSSTITFGIKAEMDNIERYYFMKIQPNGCFEINECELDLFNSSDYSEMVNIFADNNDVEGIIKFDDENINIIRKTDLFTIPEIFKIKKDLTDMKRISRGKESRDENLSSILDIKLYYQDGADYYFVGTVGAGMRSKVEKASLIRKIEGYNGSRSHFNTLLPLMNIVFVRNGQLTVYPFPFKYLNEYVLSVKTD